MKKILVLGLNFDQLPYIKVLKNLNYIIVGVDRNQNSPGSKYCNFFLNSSYTNIRAINLFLKEINFSKKDLIFTAASQTAFISLSKISKKWCIKFLSIKTVTSCIDKKKMNDLLQRFDIPIAKTIYVKDFTGIRVDKKKIYYLKSDYGKSPKYCFRIKNAKFPILPQKDDFFKRYFLLQEKFSGTHYRANVIRGNFFIFKKIKNKNIPILSFDFHSDEIKKKLKNFLSSLELKKFLIKFDIIVNKKIWCVIDIGFDPPKRLENILIYKKINFYKAYVYNWIDKKNLFENIKTNSFANLEISIKKNGNTTIVNRKSNFENSCN
tara:strand:- start:14462 stop:15427 length:966 start_codon:yes stop_codon:yes gene_type:complete